MIDRRIKELENRFQTNKTYENLRQLVMGYLVINEDYKKAIEETNKYLYLVVDLKLLFVIAYNSIEWQISPHEWIKEIENRIDPNADKSMAIYYYLKAMEIKRTDSSRKNDYIKNLQQSIYYSNAFPFANNRFALSKELSTKEAKKYYDDAVRNIIIVYREEDVIMESIEELLDVEKWIEEFIMGIRMYSGTYDYLRRFSAI